ncbi:MAG: molybdopterin-dependent oxidoreductase [Chloroflexi bacterium]|nr:molybdopterin-dependent oxidoreductase [Chloroflexota bacterium]
MSTATLDRLLAILIASQLATGLISLRAGSPPTAALFVAHGLLGGALLVAVALKLWRSVPGAVAARRWSRLALGSLLAALTVAALAGGFAWVASGRILSIGPWTVLTLHVWAALALLPIAAAHLVPRRWRLLRPRPRPGTPLMSRRALLTSAALGVLGVAAWTAANVLDAVQGGVRRFTGSRWLPAGGVPPVTTFFGEGTPPIDPETWRLRIHGRVAGERSLSLDDLASLHQTDVAAVLDCTSGWVMATTWHGLPLGVILDLAAPTAQASRVTVRSVTGWYARLPLEEARRAFLATGVAGRPLPAGNGAPLRLVAPNRRGLEWVKWVDEIEVG